MSIFFPFGIPSTSSYAVTASVIFNIDLPLLTSASFATTASFGQAGVTGSASASCPVGYLEVNYGLIAAKTRNYFLCYPPLPTPTPTPTPTLTPTPTATPTVTPTPTPTVTPTVTPTPTLTPTVTPTPI